MIGVDIVHVPRFYQWHTKSHAELHILFSESECTELFQRIQNTHREKQHHQAAQYLASRFAVKEATYKALSTLIITTPCQSDAAFCTKKSFSFRACAPHIWITKNNAWNVPELYIDYDALEAAVCRPIPRFSGTVSIAHDGEYAVATVMLTHPLPS